MTRIQLVVVGGGPAGLTAAFEARKAGISTVVFEQDPRYVGGLARTVVYQGNRFDIGGHRFFSKNPEITAWWRERLPKDFIPVRRLSRIFYRGKYFDYPLKPWNALSNLGLFTSLACLASYARSRLFPRRPERSFEDWVSNHFGRRLFTIFFKTYTEKVWGVSTKELSADWAAQRIKGLSLSQAILAAFRRRPAGAPVIKTLIDTFDYPRLGPGQMWEQVATDIQAMGGEVQLGTRVAKIFHADGRATGVEVVDAAGARRRVDATAFIVSMPLRDTVLAFDPPLPAEIGAAARRLGYRDFLTVALVVRGANPFPDNWLYVHDPRVQLGRIQNFRNWSSAMVAAEDTTCLGLEYFCFAGDALWSQTDAALVELGRRELAQLGIAPREAVVDGTVVRMEKAYPVYSADYRADVARIRAALELHAGNLQVVGRNGMHKYNNQDHSMFTSLLAVRNLQGGAFNLWNVNTDAEYHEETRPP